MDSRRSIHVTLARCRTVVDDVLGLTAGEYAAGYEAVAVLVQVRLEKARSV